MNIEIALTDLIIALNENNLQKTKQAVEYINNNFTPNENSSTLDYVIFANENSYSEDHESFNYVLDNLKYVENSFDIKWFRKISFMFERKNPQEITSFIHEQLNKENNPYKICSYFYMDLIRLANLIQDMNLIKTIQEYLIQEGE